MKKILIIGAGQGGLRVLGEIKRAHANLDVAGFIDDNTKLHGKEIQGVKILGPIKLIAEIVNGNKIDEIIIAIPSLRGNNLSALVEKIKLTKKPFKILPGIFEALQSSRDNKLFTGKIRELDLADLLNRESVKIDLTAISDYLKGKRILITGAGGSIGSEIARQVAIFNPESLVLLDIYENNLFELENELKGNREAIVADIKDKTNLEKIIAKFKPQIIFHAAAHKHVPLMEKEPWEAIKNNILGSSNLIQLAQAASVERFIFISSDKAINPTSIMGATKRFTEQEILAQKKGPTSFSIVRFGNVLGSYGSVIPLWKKQLQQSRPLTVTHPEMRRFFMTIPEAVSLVIQAGAFNNSSNIYILKMGKQYRILDLAYGFLKLSGFVPDQSAIKITQIRPGEKLSETLFEEDEKITPSKHPKISQVSPKIIKLEIIEKILKTFWDNIDKLSYRQIVEELKITIPTFVPYRELMKPKRISKIINFSPPWINKKETEAVKRVLESGWLTMGPQVIELEKTFANYYRVPNAAALNSATAGLHLALVTLGIGLDDEVILPSYTFASCANVIVHTGAKPVFADISENGFLIDPNDIKKKITSKTKAIMVVHYGGQTADMDEILAIAKKKNLKIIEDCAHSLGATYREKFAGTMGDVGVFSFYANKNMTTGEGGMVIAKDKNIIDKIKALRLHGMSLQAFDRYSAKGKWYYEISEAGFKCNMTDVAAAIGCEQLKKIDVINKKRSEAAEYYITKLKDPAIQLPQVLKQRKHVWHLFPIQVDPKFRDALIETLREFNVISSVHFIPLHLQPYYQKNYGYRNGDLPVTEQTYKREISLPIHPSLKRQDQNYIIKVIKYFLANNG